MDMCIDAAPFFRKLTKSHVGRVAALNAGRAL